MKSHFFYDIQPIAHQPKKSDRQSIEMISINEQTKTSSTQNKRNL